MRYVPNEPFFRKDEYEIKLLLQKPKFQNGVLALREKWHIYEDILVSQKAYDVWRKEILIPYLDEYEEDISQLLRDLDLTERWHQGISGYVQTDAPLVLKMKPFDPIKIEYDDEQNIKSLWIQVDKDTTRQELINAFKDARYLLGAEDKKQPPENLDRDLAVLERHRDGIKNKELAAWLNENYEGAFNTEDVKTILKRIKRKLT
jgi:hypothetical protein